MTRLTERDTEALPQSLEHLEGELKRTTGLDLVGLAARTARVTPVDARRRLRSLSAAVVPVTAGTGVIPGFTAAVGAVLRRVGLRAWITRAPDVGGFGEAVEKGADIVFAADDAMFLAMVPAAGTVVDNRWATARGFVQALAAAAEVRGRPLAGREVLVLGLGPVGREAARALQEEAALVYAYDIDPDRLERCTSEEGVEAVRSLEEALAGIDYIVDATPAAGIIDASSIRPSTIVSSPGVPHGLTPAALAKIGASFVHDKLALGVSVMAVQGSLGISRASGRTPLPRTSPAD